MDKYGVVTEYPNGEKTASDKMKCPICGAACDGEANVLKCPIHGTTPFEVSDEKENKKD
jgi:rubrerythrin